MSLLHSPSPLETDTLSWNLTLKIHTQSRNGVPNASPKTRDTRAKSKPPLIAALVTHMGISLETQTHGPRSKGQQCLSSQGMRSCPRCLLRDRFEAYESGYKNDVTSVGCSSFVTERVNTLIGQLCLMLMMYTNKDIIL